MKEQITSKQQINELQNAFDNFIKAFHNTVFYQLINENRDLYLIGIDNENNIDSYELSLDGLSEALSDNSGYIFLANNSLDDYNLTLTKIFQGISNGNAILLLDVKHNREE